MLKRVSIQNFKSLKDVTLDLQKVNLLIGPNNSGKTNFLKALAMFSRSMKSYNEDTLSEYAYMHLKGHSTITLYAESKEPTAFGKRQVEFVQLICLGSVNTKNIRHWYAESVDANTQANESIFRIADSDFWQPHPPPNAELLNKFQQVRLDYIDFVIYKPDPNKLTQPGPVGEEVELVDADASNLVNFLDLMLGKYRRTTFNRIEHDLEKCIPEFSEVNLDNVTATDELKKLHGDGKAFKRLGLTNNRQGVTYWADELSEGTLYFLALLCIINQPNPPKLLLLEEPEKGIHPRRIREVMDFIFRLAEEKDIQIILTTHNEHVLDDFATRPEAVFVFDKDEDGATYVRNLQTDIIEPTNKRNEELGLDPIDLTTNLSENWLYGLLGGVPPIA